MKLPDKLFIPKNIGFVSLAILATEYPDDIVYIRKDLLLEWAKELTSEPYDRTTESAHKHQIANYLREKYNSL